MSEKSKCFTCKKHWYKDFAYMICDINGLLNLDDVEKSGDCKDYEENDEK